MSKSSHRTHGEHGTIKAYVIGFILSLIFTAIPYYLVVNKVTSGNILLAIILGFAVLQMLVQMLFFVHLGRGPKPLYNVVFLGLTVVTIMVVVGGSIFIMNNLHYNMPPPDVSKNLIEKEGIYQIDGQMTGACQKTGTNYKITISNGMTTPVRTEARLCDTLTFINEDGGTLELTFGTHERHDTYGGEATLTARPGRAKTITLNEVGTYQFHDDLDPALIGSFTVTQ